MLTIARVNDEHHEATRRYYDEFAERYEARRGGNVPGGYHDLVDELELGFLERFARDKEVLEVGCGTGLLLEGMQSFVKHARGLDLSPRMLDRARARGLDVVEGSALALPFPDSSFDVACSFKVLAHVPDLRLALSEMLRVVRPGGTVVAELYNAQSLRMLVKRYGPAGRIGKHTTEAHVFTRFDSPADVAALLPANAHIVATRGVRILAPSAHALELPIVGPLLVRAERAVCDGPLARFGGFWICAIRKT